MMRHAFALCATLASAAARLPPLESVVFLSRHGVRTPYPPSYGTATDWRNYTNLAPPGAAAYNGMSQEAFETQQLTPHGAALIPLVGSYFRAKWANASLFASRKSHLRRPTSYKAGS